MSFNGAVTFWLRKFPFRCRKRVDFRQLQWGRNFLVTEICKTRRVGKYVK